MLRKHHQCHQLKMFVQFLNEGEVLWLNELSVKNENFVGRVWNHPVNRGLMFGQNKQIPIFDV